MKTIKEKIEKILTDQNLTFTGLAEYLNISEKELEERLNDGTLPMKLLEEVSKITRVSLYSFHRDPNIKEQRKDPYYKNNLWDEEEGK